MIKPKLTAGAARLRIWLVAHGITQQSLAAQLKLSNGSLINYVKCRQVPTLVTAAGIEQITGGAVATADWLEPYTGPLSKVPRLRTGRM